MRKGKATREERLLSQLHQFTLFGFSSEKCEQILEELISAYQGALYDYAYELSRNYDAAHDILQRAWIELYVDLWQNGEDGVYASNIPAWMRTIIYHASINYLKAQRRIISLDSSEGIWLLEPRISPFEHPDVVARRNETTEELLKMLSSLTVDQRKVISLRFFEGLKLEEIAGELRMPLSTVKSHLRRGLQKLRKLLLKKGIQSQELQVWEGYNDRQYGGPILPTHDNVLAEPA